MMAQKLHFSGLEKNRNWQAKYRYVKQVEAKQEMNRSKTLIKALHNQPEAKQEMNRSKKHI